MDGEGAEWSDFEHVAATLRECDYMDLVDRLRTELRRLWESQDDWEPTLNVFSELEDIALDIFREGGLFFETHSDGTCRVEVPFTAATMPWGRN